jgi:hypothetical protein
MPTSWLITMVVLAFVSSVGGGGRAQQTSSHRDRPDGEWAVTGAVLSARGVGGESAGDVLPRRWLFRSACRGGRCRTTFARTTGSYGIERTELVPHHGYYTATFGPSAVACERLPGLPGRMWAHYRLRWSQDRTALVAIEQAVYSGNGRCDPGTARTRWIAAPDR